MYAIVAQKTLNYIEKIYDLIPTCNLKCSQCEYQLICETAIAFEQKLKAEMAKKGVYKS